MEFSYLIALIPLYLFIYVPLSEKYWSSGSNTASRGGGDGKFSFDDSFIARDDGLPMECPDHHYDTHILSQEPLVIYIENFLTEDEIGHLLETSADQFKASVVANNNERVIDPDVRLSETATLARDTTVRCIEERSRAFQGWRSDLLLERLKIQRYGVHGHYRHHFDWSGSGRVDRISSFMVYVQADCVGGGTEFPRIPKPKSEKWCRFLECEQEDGERDGSQVIAGEGVTFKPVRGNAVFWENLRPDGSGYPETFHAGLPVLNGTKIGLNIWSWHQFRAGTF